VADRYRTIWISDLHLGTRASKAQALLNFLDRTQAERYYLVGDIFDGWALQRSWYWPDAHNEVLRALLDVAGRAEVIYVPGNHDAAAQQFLGLQLGGITIRRNTVHTTADDRSFLVLHGDEFDGAVRHARWVSRLGGWAYEQLLALSRYVNHVRRWMDLPYWSLAAAAKTRTKRAVQYIADFEQAVVQRASQRGVDGIVCGHIHVPALRTIQGIDYANTGDWVESCTALVEHPDGHLDIRHWSPSQTKPAPYGDGVPSPQRPTLGSLSPESMESP